MDEEKWFSKVIDADRFYTVIEDLFRQWGPPFVDRKLDLDQDY